VGPLDEMGMQNAKLTDGFLSITHPMGLATKLESTGLVLSCSAPPRCYLESRLGLLAAAAAAAIAAAAAKDSDDQLLSAVAMLQPQRETVPRPGCSCWLSTAWHDARLVPGYNRLVPGSTLRERYTE